MRRREFMIGLSLAITVTPIWAQHGEKVYRIAFVHPSTPVVELRSSTYGFFFEELRKLGYVEGQNLTVDGYSGGGHPEIQPRPPASSPHGRGLFIVDQLSDEWGVLPARRGSQKSVWFRISMRGAQGMRS